MSSPRARLVLRLGRFAVRQIRTPRDAAFALSLLVIVILILLGASEQDVDELADALE